MTSYSSEKNLVRTSKLLSLVLRHEPGRIGIALDGEGWVPVATLVEAACRAGMPLTADLVKRVVETSDKKRFALSSDGVRIRANQGHSVEVDLGLKPQAPPARLYHGTVARFLDSIRATGLVKGARHHVHLSADEETATKVGDRRGDAVILRVRAEAMARAGHLLYRSENGVWLADAVPAEFIEFPDSAGSQ